MIANDQELQVTQEWIARFQEQVAHLRATETDPENYRAAVSGFLAEIDRMQLEVREYLSLHPTELAATADRSRWTCSSQPTTVALMSPLADEAARIVELLPAEKAEALLDYARYLAEAADREAWERRFSDPRYAERLQASASAALAEFRAGRTQTLDAGQM